MLGVIEGSKCQRVIECSMLKGDRRCVRSV